ncbi:hypothetical protein D3Z41_18730 [Parabacteroides distasonis]|nr:hypothetical protein [Parabacteroides distasonis]
MRSHAQRIASLDILVRLGIRPEVKGGTHGSKSDSGMVSTNTTGIPNLWYKAVRMAHWASI